MFTGVFVVVAEAMKYLIWAASPVGVWIFLNALAWMGLFGRRGIKAAVVVIAHAQLLLFCMPWVSDRLIGHLESDALALQSARPLQAPVDAIVVLGGGLETAYSGVRDLPDLKDSADRVWVGARLYKQGVAPLVVVSGGSFSQDSKVEVEAVGMARFLMDLGVPSDAILKEMKSRTTLENAWQTLELLDTRAPEGSGLGAASKKTSNRPFRIALVTSAFHMSRAVTLFEGAGFKVYPVRADVRVTPQTKPFWQWLPDGEALDDSTTAVKEYLGRLQYGLTRYFKEGAQ
ncbi:MAG: YdcF family protein [Limnobacter sp.]|nr:YdcF family protein [Limnobacter sp.]